MPNLGAPELIIILVIALVVLGPKRLPGLGKQLGTGMREFKDSVSGITGNDDDDDEKPALTASKAEKAPAPAPAPAAETTTTPAEKTSA